MRASSTASAWPLPARTAGGDRGRAGAGIVVPNLLHWDGSVVCTDITHENWQLTAGHRASRGQECHLYDPLHTEGRTSRSNPFTQCWGRMSSTN